MRGVSQNDAQSIQYALVDYFRYVAGHVAYGRVAELERKLEEARLELGVRQEPSRG